MICTRHPARFVYVGVTKNGAQRRYGHHLHAAEKGEHRNAALSEILLEHETCCVVLEAVEERSQSGKAESKWIAHFRSMGIQLCNHTTGGYAWPRIDDELFGKAVSKGKLGRPFSKAHRRAIGKASKGRRLSEETKRKMSRAHKGRSKSAETRQRMSKARKGVPLSEEHKRKLSEALRGRSCSAMLHERSCKYDCGFVGTGYQMSSHIQFNCLNAPKRRDGKA